MRKKTENDITKKELENNLNDSFSPVVCNIKEEIKKASKNPKYKAAMEELNEEFALLEVMLEAQRRSQLSQTEIAARMGTQQPAVNRIIRRKVKPSFKTAVSFIHANGFRIKSIEIEPCEG